MKPKDGAEGLLSEDETEGLLRASFRFLNFGAGLQDARLSELRADATVGASFNSGTSPHWIRSVSLPSPNIPKAFMQAIGTSPASSSSSKFASVIP